MEQVNGPSSTRSLGKKALAGLVLLVAVFLVISLAIKLILAVALPILVIAAIVAIIWAVKVL
jgi:hypothetical protein